MVNQPDLSAQISQRMQQGIVDHLGRSEFQTIGLQAEIAVLRDLLAMRDVEIADLKATLDATTATP